MYGDDVSLPLFFASQPSNVPAHLSPFSLSLCFDLPSSLPPFSHPPPLSPHHCPLFFFTVCFYRQSLIASQIHLTFFIFFLSLPSFLLAIVMRLLLGLFSLLLSFPTVAASWPLYSIWATKTRSCHHYSTVLQENLRLCVGRRILLEARYLHTFLAAKLFLCQAQP